MIYEKLHADTGSASNFWLTALRNNNISKSKLVETEFELIHMNGL